MSARPPPIPAEAVAGGRRRHSFLVWFALSAALIAVIVLVVASVRQRGICAFAPCDPAPPIPEPRPARGVPGMVAGVLGASSLAAVALHLVLRRRGSRGRP